jgi:hypothetical protein
MSHPYHARRVLVLVSALLIAGTSAVQAQKTGENPDLLLSPGGTCTPGVTDLCNPLDDTFTVVRFDGAGGSGPADPADPCQRNDDDVSLAIALPFVFNFYGSPQSSVYINNNGNISFGGPFSTFTPTGFPVAAFPMIAPFWSDVDTRGAGSGVVYYKVEANRLTVTWDHTGYYAGHDDKLNTFQVIISDGTDPLVGIGNNVCFCYDDMTWTTGDASGGVGGFGGTAATVGINRGDGVDYAQVGRFDHAGADWDGPFGNNDGVSYLDNRRFCFDASVDDPVPVEPSTWGGLKSRYGSSN